MIARCVVGHLGGIQPPAVALEEEGPVCEDCARALFAQGCDIQPMLLPPESYTQPELPVMEARNVL